MKCWKVDTSYSQHEHEVRIVSLAVQVTRVHAIQPLAYEQHPPLLLEALSAQQTNPLLMLLLHPLDNPIHVLVLNHTTRLLEDWDSNYPHLRIAAILNTYQLPTDDVATFKRVLVVVWNIHSHAYSLWILVLRNDATYGDVGIDLDVPKTAEFILQSILNDERTFSPSDRPVSCWMECIWSQNEANEGPLDDVDLMEYVTTRKDERQEPFHTIDASGDFVLWIPPTTDSAGISAYKFTFSQKHEDINSLDYISGFPPQLSCKATLLLHRPQVTALAPVVVTRSNPHGKNPERDVLCLLQGDDGTLSFNIWTGFTTMAVLPLFPPALHSAISKRKVLLLRETRGKDTSCVSLLVGATEHSLRVDFMQDTITRACMDALRLTLPGGIYEGLVACVLWIVEANEDGCEDDFGLFVRALLISCGSRGFESQGPKEESLKAGVGVYNPDTPDTDWEYLMDRGASLGSVGTCVAEKFSTTASHPKCELQAIKKSAVIKDQGDKHDIGLGPLLENVLVTLHLVAESLKLDCVLQSSRARLVALLKDLSAFIGWPAYAEYYQANKRPGGFGFPSRLSNDYLELKHSPPNILAWVLERVKTRKPSDFPSFCTVAAAFNSDVFPVSKVHHMPITRRLDQITNIYNSWTIDTVDAIVTTMTTNAFSLNNLDSLPIGVALPLREFLSACRRNPHNGWTVEYYAMIGREDFAEQASGNKCLTLHKSVPLPQHRPVAMEPATELLSGVELENSEVTNLRFQDDRIEVVQKIMTCRQVPSLNAKVFADSTDDLIRSEQQNVLMSFANKLFALPIGRALFTFGTASNAVSETVHFPQVTVSAKLPPLNDVVHLDPTQAPQDLFEWPNFHNGVATGLRIPESSTAVHASWLEKNNPSTPTCNNGGFIFAMGLLGHLKKLERWQRMVYLQHQHVVTTVGMVLGVGASLCGTGDAYATKLMKVHIPRLNNFGPSGDRVDGASNVASEGTRCTGGVTHTASVFGLGLLHLGTSKRRFVEVLIDEIAAVDYALDDGSDSGAEGSFNERVKNREGHSVTAGLALGMVVLGKGSMARGLDGIGLLERLLGHIAGKGRDGIDGAGGEISAAGATIALGLMYLKTGDESVAAKLEIPETRHMLDYVRSDLLLVRTLSRNLVLWDATRATKQWIEDQVPAYVQEVVLLFDDDDGSLESLRHARYNIIAGACLSLAIKFAGSSSEEVFRLLLKYLDDFNLEASFPAITYREKLNKSVVRTCCDVIVVSLGVVMAGSGNLELLRRFHKLSDRISTDVSYGSHMALQMALGFLFLGGAAGFTLGSSDQAVAALVCALYPRFPMSAEDNCCHLQPLRHMWVMAVERRRCLVVRDVESRQACRIPVLITLKGDGKGTYPLVLRTWAPCILPELTRIKSVSVDSDRYLSLTVVGDEYLRRLFDTHTLFVKRKSGHLDYVKDPKGRMGVLSRSFPKPNDPVNSGHKSKNPRLSENDNFLDFILTSFSHDPRILSFAEHLCSHSNSESGTSFGFSGFCLRALRECLEEDKSDALVIYAELHELIKHSRTHINPDIVYNLEIVSQYYEANQENIESGESKLLNQLFVGSLRCQLEALFRGKIMTRDAPLVSVGSSANASMDFVVAPTPTDVSLPCAKFESARLLYETLRERESVLNTHGLQVIQSAVAGSNDELAVLILREMQEGVAM